MMSLLMVRGKIFSKASGVAGILGFGLLLIFEINKSFVPSLDYISILVATGGGLASMVWYILIAQRLFQLR